MNLFVTPIDWRRELPSAAVASPAAEHITPSAARGVRRVYRELRTAGLAPTAARQIVTRLLGIGWVAGHIDANTTTPQPTSWRVVADHELAVLG